MKKIILSALVLGFLSLWILPEAITTPFMHLLILGIVPGTDFSIGFALPLVAWLIAVYFLVQWLSEASQAMLEYKTQMNRLEEQEKETQELIKTGEAANELMDEEIDIISI